MTYATTALIVLSAASAGIAAYSGYTQAQTSKKIAENNANVADMQAKDALARGEKARIAAHQRGQQIEGQQRTALSARGLDLSEGTANDILGQTDFFTQTDEATARTNARKEAFNAEAQKANYQLQEDGVNPGLTLAGGLLSGGSAVADKWYRYGK
jgi:hypothetical protein